MIYLQFVFVRDGYNYRHLHLLRCLPRRFGQSKSLAQKQQRKIKSRTSISTSRTPDRYKILNTESDCNISTKLELEVFALEDKTTTILRKENDCTRCSLGSPAAGRANAPLTAALQPWLHGGDAPCLICVLAIGHPICNTNTYC